MHNGLHECCFAKKSVEIHWRRTAEFYHAGGIKNIKQFYKESV